MASDNLKRPGRENDPVAQDGQAAKSKKNFQAGRDERDERAGRDGPAVKNEENPPAGLAGRQDAQAVKDARAAENAQPAQGAESGQSSPMTVVTENYIFHQDGPEELPEGDPRKGTVSDPNLQDRAWVNRKFTFNLKRR